MFLTNGTRIFVVILNYLHVRDTVRCVASLRRSQDRNLHLLVVDNGSDRSGRLADLLGPAVPVIATGANLGYAGGNNVGIAHALSRDADYIWLLNPDTEVEPRALQLMTTTMEIQSDAGFVGSLNLVGGSVPPRVQFAGGHIDWEGGAVVESVGIGRPLAEFRATEPYRVDYVAGTSMLVRRAVFEEMGLLPEEYFLYFEETDFQWRARTRGWLSYLNPTARVWHHQRSAGDLPAPQYVYYYIRGRLLFGRRHSDLSLDMLEEGLAGFIDGWRARVQERDKNWLVTFDRLTALAISDGRAGRTGRRDDLVDLVESDC